jgi:hypothetical protein
MNDEGWEEGSSNGGRRDILILSDSPTHEVMTFFGPHGLGQISCSHRGTRRDQRADPDSPACFVHRVGLVQNAYVVYPGCLQLPDEVSWTEILLAQQGKVVGLEKSEKDESDKTTRRVANIEWTRRLAVLPEAWSSNRTEPT